MGIGILFKNYGYILYPITVLLLIILCAYLYMTWANKKMNQSTSKKRTKTINGKLIRKVKDNNEQVRSVKNLRRNYYGMNQVKTKDVRKYYITFETPKGIRSFTVVYRDYNAIKLGQEGIITMQGKRFVSFEKKHFGI